MPTQSEQKPFKQSFEVVSKGCGVSPSLERIYTCTQSRNQVPESPCTTKTLAWRDFVPMDLEGTRSEQKTM